MIFQQKLYRPEGNGRIYLKNWKGKSTTTITVPSKDLIQNWWRNEKLFRQAKVKRIQYHQTSLTAHVKGTYIIKKCKKRKKDLQNQIQAIKKNGNRNIYINNYSKCKWIKCSNQKTQTGWMDKKNKAQIYAVYKRPTSDLKTHIDWKWEDGKIYSMQMGSKRKLE